MIDQNELFQSVRLAHENAATVARLAQRQAEMTEQLAAARRRADVAEVLAMLPIVYVFIRAAVSAAKKKSPTAPRVVVPPRADDQHTTADDHIRAACLAALRRMNAEPKGA